MAPPSDGDDRLREEFGLQEDTTTLLPARTPDVDRFIVRLPPMTEVQARAVLEAARKAGVRLR